MRAVIYDAPLRARGLRREAIKAFQHDKTTHKLVIDLRL